MIHHIAVSIRGLEARLNGNISKRYGTWRIFFREDGTLANKREVRKLVEEHKKLGHEVISACDNVDEKGHCKGHKQIYEI